MARRGEAPAVLAASAAQVRMEDEDPADLSAQAKRVGSSQAWQREVLKWFDKGGEVWFGASWVGNALSQILWNVAHGSRREPAVDADGNPREGVDQTALKIAEEALSRLTGLSERQGDWARTTGELFTLVGESWLVGYHVNEEDEPVEGEDLSAVREVWEAVSPAELDKRANSGRVEVRVKRSAGDDKGMLLPTDHTLVHMWRRHPRWPDDATSPMRALVESGVIELLDLINKGFKGSALSRTHAGILGFDARAVQKLTARVIGPDGSEGPTRLVTEIVEGLVTPKGDPTSASWIAPTLLTFDLQEGQTVRSVMDWLDIRRDTTDSEIKVLELCLRRMALGLDVPAEILLGIGGLNHWASWQVDETAYKNHLAALVGTVADCITVGYLWPEFRMNGVSPEVYRPFRVGADPSALLVHPDRSKDAVAVFTVGGLSWEALRKYSRFEEADAPTPEELEQRAALGFTRSGRPEQEASAEAVEKGPAKSDNPAEARSVVRSASRPSVADLGRQAAQIEASHLRDTLMLADRAVNEALRKAGAKLRNRAERRPELKALVRGVDARLVGSHLGPSRVFQLAQENGDQGLDSLFAESTADMERSYTSITLAAQRRFRRAIERATGEEFDEFEQARMDEDAERSRGVLLAGVMAVAAARLLDPTAYAPAAGEQPAGVNVPASVARRASAAAGGAAVSGGATRLERFEGGLASGPTARDLTAAHGLGEEGWTFVYGDALRERPYEPHVELDGATFFNFEDVSLPEGPFGPETPGNHEGCMCTAALHYSITEAGDTA